MRLLGSVAPQGSASRLLLATSSGTALPRAATLCSDPTCPQSGMPAAPFPATVPKPNPVHRLRLRSFISRRYRGALKIQTSRKEKKMV